MNLTQLKKLTLGAGLLLGMLFVVQDLRSTLGGQAIAETVAGTVEPAHQAQSQVPDKSGPPQEKPAQSQEKTAEEVYKNIQIFKGLPAPGVMRAMQFFTRSLGVECTHCHVAGELEKDDKPTKQTARKMYAMVQLSNKTLGSNRVSCYACHRGHTQPDPPPDSWKAKLDELRKQGEQDQRPAEQVYKNVQTLKGVPAGRWMMIMTMFTNSLGVDCTHCHVPGAFEKDDKPAKQTARKMLGMVGAIAREIYKGPTSINCYTCHKGQPQPVSFPPAATPPPRESAADEKAPDLISAGPLPSVDLVLDKHIAATGGKVANARLTTRVFKGALLTQGRISAPLEVYAKAPDRVLMIMSIPGSPTTFGFNGSTAWQKNQSGVREMTGPEAEFARGQARSFAGLSLKDAYTKMEVKGKAKLGEREAFVVDATQASGASERLYFDIQTGLLTRQEMTIEDPRGKNKLVLELEDYRDVDGVKLPFVRRWSRPGFTFTQKFEEIKANVAIDDAKFEKPSQ